MSAHVSTGLYAVTPSHYIQPDLLGGAGQTDDAWAHSTHTFAVYPGEAGYIVPEDMSVTHSASPDKQSSTETRSSSKSSKKRTAQTSPASSLESKKRRVSKKARRENEETVQNPVRDKFLERNRVAASKCRQKKKKYVSELEETKNELESQHGELQSEYNELLGHLSRMKDQLMAHAHCNDANIDSWIGNEARKFVQRRSGFPGSNYAAFSHGSDSMPVGSAAAYPGSRYSDSREGSRANDVVVSSASTFQPSPTDTTFIDLAGAAQDDDADINYDHMPDALFSAAA